MLRPDSIRFRAESWFTRLLHAVPLLFGRFEVVETCMSYGSVQSDSRNHGIVLCPYRQQCLRQPSFRRRLCLHSFACHTFSIDCQLAMRPFACKCSMKHFLYLCPKILIFVAVSIYARQHVRHTFFWTSPALLDRLLAWGNNFKKPFIPVLMTSMDNRFPEPRTEKSAID